ncbi:MAG: hypothetical protein U1F44_02520 [Coriobacteriia bacterium]|nr:hypothetical protein [Coriobacteriia bacterium]
MERIHRTSSEETIGARMYKITRQRAVERAIERLRAGLKADWQFLTYEDIENLRWFIGEIWATCDRADWEDLHFSKLDLRDTRILAGQADRLRRHGTLRGKTLELAVGVLREAGERARHAEFLSYADEAAAQV